MSKYDPLESAGTVLIDSFFQRTNKEKPDPILMIVSRKIIIEIL